jgi:hypothetical protein
VRECVGTREKGANDIAQIRDSCVMSEALVKSKWDKVEDEPEGQVVGERNQKSVLEDIEKPAILEDETGEHRPSTSQETTTHS